MEPSQQTDESLHSVPADIRVRVMAAVLDELARWGVERFSVEAMRGSATASMRRRSTGTGVTGSN